jgi:hypothetical protein
VIVYKEIPETMSMSSEHTQVWDYSLGNSVGT